MPNTTSAKKALRQSKIRAERNRTAKLRLKQSLKLVSQETAAQTVSYVDKAVKQGLIHRNKAGRLKAKIARSTGTATSKRPRAGKTPAKTARSVAKQTTKKNA